MTDELKLSKSDIHPHLSARMLQRGVTKEEIEEALAKGKEAEDTKPGTYGKVLAFPYNDYWGEQFYGKKKSPCITSWQEIRLSYLL